MRLEATDPQQKNDFEFLLGSSMMLGNKDLGRQITKADKIKSNERKVLPGKITSDQLMERGMSQHINFIDNSLVPKIANRISYAMGKQQTLNVETRGCKSLEQIFEEKMAKRKGALHGISIMDRTQYDAQHL